MAELIALYLAGLSFFFTGIAGISSNLRQLSGQRFRNLLARATGGPVRAGLLGAAAGTVTQSTSVVAFILSGMVSSGLLPLRQALLVLSCSNIGTAALVMIAAVDLHLPVLFLIGVCGILLAFQLFMKWRPGIAALLSVGLLFFGLDMMKQAFRPLAGSQSFAEITRFLDHWPHVTFLLGLLMRSVIHSSAGCAAIIITVDKAGLLSEFPALMAIAGLGVGAAVATYLVTSHLRGISRQISWYQILSNAGAGILVGALLTLEHATGVPMLQALAAKLTPTLPGQIALTYLALNLTIAAVGIACLRWAPEWLARISPATPEQDLSRPMYVRQEALLSPETAPELAALEQLRIIGVLNRYLNAAREGQGTPLKPLHEAALSLEDEISQFLESLLKHPLETDLAARILSFQHKQETLHSLEENVYLFADTLRGSGGNTLAGTLVEALDTILLTASDALTTHDAMDIDMLVRLTDDRGGMMEQLRDRLRQDNAGNMSDVAALHYATTLFERNVWLLRQIALWLREDAKLTTA